MRNMGSRSVVIDGHRTSLSLEDPFWSSLKDIALLRGVPVANLIYEINGQRSAGNLSSAIRQFVLGHYRSLTP